MRIAERLGVQQLRVQTHLRGRVQTRTGVIQIGLPMLIEASIVGGAQRVEVTRRLVLLATSYRLPASR